MLQQAPYIDNLPALIFSVGFFTYNLIAPKAAPTSPYVDQSAEPWPAVASDHDLPAGRR